MYFLAKIQAHEPRRELRAGASLEKTVRACQFSSSGQVRCHFYCAVAGNRNSCTAALKRQRAEARSPRLKSAPATGLRPSRRIRSCGCRPCCAAAASSTRPPRSQSTSSSALFPLVPRISWGKQSGGGGEPHWPQHGRPGAAGGAGRVWIRACGGRPCRGQATGRRTRRRGRGLLGRRMGALQWGSPHLPPPGLRGKTSSCP